jgi:hypothetical protein
MDDETVRTIIAMIDSRRVKLDTRWAALERGTVESGEVLSRTDELAELKWAILDVHRGYELPDEIEPMIAPVPAAEPLPRGPRPGPA